MLSSTARIFRVTAVSNRFRLPSTPSPFISSRRGISENSSFLNKPLPAEDPELLGKYAKKPIKDTEQAAQSNVNPKTGEIDGPKGPEPTRFGDYERSGRCFDF